MFSLLSFSWGILETVCQPWAKGGSLDISQQPCRGWRPWASCPLGRNKRGRPPPTPTRQKWGQRCGRGVTGVSLKCGLCISHGQVNATDSSGKLRERSFKIGKEREGQKALTCRVGDMFITNKDVSLRPRKCPVGSASFSWLRA